jgi:hypothetical protein
MVLATRISSFGLSLGLRSRPSYTEKDWNEDAVPHVEKMGLGSVGFHSYSASKVLAEKAFWSGCDADRNEAVWTVWLTCPEFIEDEKPSWDGVTVNPPLVSRAWAPPITRNRR